ncbi:MAG: potassium transporter TrkG [Arcanobacterium sp.]
MRISKLAGLLTVSFLLTVAIGTFLLMLPVSSTGDPGWASVSAGPQIGTGVPLSVAFFTAMSATSVTGLIIVDTATYWTTFGQFVLMMLFELGGLGSMTMISFIVLALTNNLGLGRRELSSYAFGVSGGEAKRVIVGAVKFSFAMQLAGFILLTIRLLYLGKGLTSATWEGAFLAVSAFNNAGFAPYSDNLIGFSHDPFILLPISFLIIGGGLGFPVVIALRRHRFQWRKLRLTARMVLVGTASLIIGGTTVIGALEWNNPATLGNMPVPIKILNAYFSAVSPRTAGFNSIDIAVQHSETWAATDFLMFIGGSPAGTAGGIKTTTMLVVFFVVLRELRGSQYTNALGWQLDQRSISQAMTVVGISTSTILVATFIIRTQSGLELGRVLFEVTSALGTVGLTTGITPTLPISAQLILTFLMMVGRVGPVTVATALVLRKKKDSYALPIDKPLIG